MWLRKPNGIEKKNSPQKRAKIKYNLSVAITKRLLYHLHICSLIYPQLPLHTHTNTLAGGRTLFYTISLQMSNGRDFCVCWGWVLCVCVFRFYRHHEAFVLAQLGLVFLASPCQSNESNFDSTIGKVGQRGEAHLYFPQPSSFLPFSFPLHQRAGLTCSFPRYTKRLAKHKHKLPRLTVLRQPTWTLARNQARKSSPKKALFFNHGQILSLFLSSGHQHAAVSSKTIVHFTSKENCWRKKEILGDPETNYSICCGYVILGESFFFRKSKECQVCGGYWGWPWSRM